MTITKLISALVLTLAAATAHAASVSLVPRGLDVNQGATFDIDLVLDATDTLVADNPGSMSGVVVIQYDTALASFGGFSYNSPASSNEPLMTMPGDNSIEIIGLDFTNGPTTGVIGTYSFTALAAPGSVIDIIFNTQFTVGFINESPTNKPFFPDLENASVSVVPLPASVWLMMSALGLIACRVRRAR